MAEVKPFAGLLYNSEKINGDYSGVMAPPYDVISREEQDELYEKSDCNIVRLILGRVLESDDADNNKYTRAGALLDEWQKQGVLKRDDIPAFYVYVQEYDYKGETCRRIGFIGLMKIGEPGNDPVLPHEYTLAKPKEDRLNLIKQVKTNLSPIFTLYEDSQGIIPQILEQGIFEADPIIDVDIKGIVHRFWSLSDRKSVDAIVSRMNGRKAFIADGHHRYEVARMYRDLRRKDEGYDGSADYLMVYFSAFNSNNDLTVMATHRVVKNMPFEGQSKIGAKLGEYFSVEEYSGLSELMGRLEKEIDDDHAFGYFDGKQHYFAKAKDKDKLLGIIKEEKTFAWKNLDVSMLHAVVFNNLLSIDEAEGNISYARDPETAEQFVKSGEYKTAFFLNPTRVEQLKAVAESGEMMPQKSTYFYPKLLTGLVINKHGQ
ncbi:MAG: DUF1015 domain-containing protein [Candidatus Omnitrophota bacterium]